MAIQRGWSWPEWAPRVLFFRFKCPRCKSEKCKAAELRPYDGLLGLFAMHPVRCLFCWRRFYWMTLARVPLG